MPFKSKKQMAKFASLVKQGKLHQDVFDTWARHTPDPKSLPEVAKPKKSKETKFSKWLRDRTKGK